MTLPIPSCAMRQKPAVENMAVLLRKLETLNNTFLGPKTNAVEADLLSAEVADPFFESNGMETSQAETPWRESRESNPLSPCY